MKVYPSPFTLIGMLVRNGRLPMSRLHIAMIYVLRSILMYPGILMEWIFLSRRIRAHQIPEDPIFILGHYRSGTTYIHKLMATNQDWGIINTYNFLFPYSFSWIEKILKPVLQALLRLTGFKHPHFHNYDYNLDDPMEEDTYLAGSCSPYSAFWGEMFPMKAMEYFDRNLFFESPGMKEDWEKVYLFCIKKFSLKNKGKQLLLKNPPNTGRVRSLLKLFPDAKFIFIYRNPYQVYYSTYHLWKRTLEKMYLLQNVSEAERDEIIFQLYSKMMMQYEKDREMIPPENLVEVRYETLEKDPFTEVGRIYRHLGLPGFEIVEEELNKRLGKEKKYRKYKYTYDEGIQEKIHQQWGYFIDKWNYERLLNK